MYAPGGLSPKAAPSIWSFDSGYQSEDKIVQSNQVDTQTNSPKNYSLSLDGDGGLGLTTPFVYTHNSNQLQSTQRELSIDPALNTLSVFTTTDTSQHNLFLPRLPIDGDSCIKCEFWKISTEGENNKCEDCRAIPEIIEPHHKSNDSNTKKTLHLTIPEHTVDMAATKRRCSACELAALVNPNQPQAPCSSCSPDGLLSPISPTQHSGTARRSRAGRNSKLPLAALNRLQAWLDAHTDDPYPSAEDKRQLAQDCGITEKQVTTWFTNARARQLSPLDTYLSSGSEDEAADPSDIESAAQTPTYAVGLTYLPGHQQTRERRRAGSVSANSALSGGRTQPSRRGKKKIYRNPLQSPASDTISPTSHLAVAPQTNPLGDHEMWQCTFCRRNLVPKSWRRHEETQHRPRSQWTCMLFGARITYPHRAGSFCAFCMAKDPSDDHFVRNHRIQECAKRPIGERTFFRPDHLRQHIKNFHNATLYDVVQARWKKAADIEVGAEGWMCGFCGEQLPTWDKRETHIANHFKEGMTMDQWMSRDKPKKALPEFSKPKVEEMREKPRGSSVFNSLARRWTGSRPEPYPLPTSSFAHTFTPLPTTTAPMTIEDYSQPPRIPDFDPFMSGFGNPVEWPNFEQFSFPEDPFQATNGQQPGIDDMMNNVLGLGNVIDPHQPGPWSQDFGTTVPCTTADTEESRRKRSPYTSGFSQPE